MMRRSLLRSLLLSLAIACGRAAPSSAPAGESVSHAALPQLVDQGGPVLTAPRVITVTFPGDVDAVELGAFGAQATHNAWWDTVRQGFCASGACVGDGPTGAAARLTDAPATSYTDSSHDDSSELKTFIRAQLAGGNIPQPDAQTIVAVYFPQTTTITLDGAESCSEFAAYHATMTSGDVRFMYVVVNDCPEDPGYRGPPRTKLQERTFAASHEIIEAATDPFITSTTSGFYLDATDPSGLPWNNLAGGEAADLCEDLVGLGQDQTSEGGFTVTRVWNDTAARSGGDPCVPASGAAYFNAAPEKWLLEIPVGGSATFTAEAFAPAATSEWILFGGDFNATEDDPSPYLSVTIGGARSATVKAGERVTVTVKLVQDPANLPDYPDVYGATGLLVSADDPRRPTVAHVWPFLVTTPDGAKSSGLGRVDPTARMRVQRRFIREAP
jgi:hypothetical protein